MTISLRNHLQRAGVLLSLLLMLAFIATACLLYFRAATHADMAALLSQDKGSLPTVALATSLYLVVFSFVAGILLQTFFGKTISTEMFFFVFFVISLSFESIRIAQADVIVSNMPAYYGIVLTRIIYFARFFGVFCLFVSGLYATGVDYQRFEVVLGVCLLLAFTLAFSIPLDSRSPLPNFVNALGGDGQILAVFIAFEVFSVLNYLLAAFLKRNKTYVLMAAGILLTVVGGDGLYFLCSPVPDIAAALVLAAGTTLFANRTHVVYLWT